MFKNNLLLRYFLALHLSNLSRLRSALRFDVLSRFFLCVCHCLPLCFLLFCSKTPNIDKAIKSKNPSKALDSKLSQSHSGGNFSSNIKNFSFNFDQENNLTHFEDPFSPISSFYDIYTRFAKDRLSRYDYVDAEYFLKKAEGGSSFLIQEPGQDPVKLEIFGVTTK